MLTDSDYFYQRRGFRQSEAEVGQFHDVTLISIECRLTVFFFALWPYAPRLR
jgi:hypothetical protein